MWMWPFWMCSAWWNLMLFEVIQTHHLSHKKDPLTFHESSWLVNRNPYIGLWNNPYITGARMSSPIYPKKQPLGCPFFKNAHFNRWENPYLSGPLTRHDMPDVSLAACSDDSLTFADLMGRVACRGHCDEAKKSGKLSNLLESEKIS